MAGRDGRPVRAGRPVMPRVSIVIPTYNRSMMVRRAIDSVLAQTFQDFEILVVDDGSTDDTRDALAAYPESVRYVPQANQGPAAARNHGMRLARGDYIGFLDSDDLYLPHNLEAHLRQFQANPAAGLVYSGGAIVDHEGRWIKDSRPDPRYRGDVLERLVYYNFIIPSTVLMSRPCMEFAGPMNTRLWFAEDWYYWLRIASRYPVDFVDDILVRYQRTKGSLSHGKPIAELAKRNIEMFELAFADPDLRGRLSPLRAEAYRRAYANYAAMALEEYRMGLARGLALRAIGARPLKRESYPLLLKSLLPAGALRALRRRTRGPAS